MNTKKKESILLLLLASVALIWGFGFVFTKIVLAYIAPALLNFLRFFLSSIALFALYYKKDNQVNTARVAYRRANRSSACCGLCLANLWAQ
jgi:EamA-like transporter family.